MTLEEALRRYLVQLEANGRSSHTIGQYRRHVQFLATWLATDGASTAIESITHETLARFVASDTARLRPDGEAKTATSLNALRSSIRTFVRHCHEAGYITSNPARLIRRAVCSPPPPRALTDDEVERLLAVLDDGESFEARRDAALVRTLLGTGLRISSALALRVEDVDLVAREITIRSSKGNRPDRLPISTEVGEILGGWIGDRTGGALFGARSGRSICSRHAQRRFRHAAQSAGIQRDVSPHSTRHRFAAVLYRRCGDLGVVQAALLHRSIASTLVYARADTERLRAAIG